jgi:hypothetical protein
MIAFANDENIHVTPRARNKKEILRELSDLVEHMHVYRLVKEREKTDIDEFIPIEQVLKENE